MKQSGNKPWFFLPFILISSFVLNLYLGSVHIPLPDLAGILLGKKPENQIWSDIIWQFRMTKALTCILAGASLSLAGLAMQTLFRNALAGPDVLGISSGSSLAVSLIIMGQAAWLPSIAAGPWTTAGAASVGATAILLVVFAISRQLRDNNSLLIVGLMIGATVTSLVSVLQYISNADDQQVYLIWTFGSLGGLSYPEIAVLGLVLLAAAGTLVFASKSMNAWLLGENYATSLGIDPQSARMVMILAACILTGAVTAFCGPIAFVGLAVPHFSRIIFRTHDHLVLIPVVVVNGAILLLLCDVASQLPGTSYVLPINAITALVGAPAVISIIMRARQVSL
ncbi:iron ABC transporter permease [Chryseolinea sp. T2]|uniref:FecCD family ABC transporter permease n=1 Tax=Chryseolinea sp. T2 TaxID=3129255 RepID=UPI003078461F